MTIGRSSRKGTVRSSIRAPKFLDKSGGFYGRLSEPESAPDGGQVRGGEVEEEVQGVGTGPSHTLDREEVFGFTDGAIEDDEETLLRRKPSRLSNKWRRSSRRKQKEEKREEEQPQEGGDAPLPERERMEGESQAKEHPLVHFQVREFADDQVLIRDKKRGREEEEEEERKMKKEQEEGMKVVKRKNYRKAFDRALRRGWEAFITNLYSVTLTPVTPSPPSSPSLKKKQHSSVLAEFQ